MLLAIFFVYNALRSQPLPGLKWPMETRPYHALKEKEKARERQKSAALHNPSGNRRLHLSQVTLNAEEGIRAAFYDPTDAASFRLSSASTPARLICSFPEWLSVLTPDGRLQSVDPLTTKFFDVVQGDNVHTVDDKVMPFLKTENTGMEVFPVW